MEENEESLNRKIGELIKLARTKPKDETERSRVSYLQEAEGTIFSESELSLLDNFLDEMLEFLSERSGSELNKFTLSFIEKAINKDPDVLKKAIQNLTFILDENTPYNPQIQKRAIATCTNIYPNILKWAYERKNDPEATKSWQLFAKLKARVLSFLDSPNEGFRVYSVKFMESVILTQSCRSDFSVVREGDSRFDLTGISLIDHRFISQRQMESEMNHAFTRLIDELSSSSITSQTLLAILQVLCNIAKQRPERMTQVISSLESLHINLPPTLATHQVKSLRKELRYHMLKMLRHPVNFSHHPRLQHLLTELGSSQSEIERNMPARQEVAAVVQKRSALARAAAGAAHQPGPSTSKEGPKRPGEGSGPEDSKKFKLNDEDYLDEGTAEILRSADGKQDLADASQKAIDITTDFVNDRLSLNVVVKLVSISLFTLPDEMPPAFQATFTRIDNAGTEEQKRHLARIIAMQLTREGIGPGIEHLREQQQRQYLARQAARLEGAVIPPTPGRENEKEKPTTSRDGGFARPAPPKKTRIAEWNIFKNTKELLLPQAESLSLMAFQRIMENERRANQGGAFLAQHQLLTRLATRYLSKTHEQFTELLIEYIIADQKNRAELALLWLNELFIQYGGYSVVLTAKGEPDAKEKYIRYDTALCSILGLLFNRKDNKETLFHRILLEVPLVTPAALTWLKKSCLDPIYGAFGMTTLREMILTRPRQRPELLKLFLSFSYYEPVISTERSGQVVYDARDNCVNTAKELYMVDYIRDDLRDAVVEMSYQLTLPFAPKDLIIQVRRLSAEEIEELRDETPWEEELVKAAIHLLVALLPSDDSLLIHLAQITAKSTKDAQRTIFNCIVQAIKAIDMHSKELLKTIEECPVGAEVLIARIVNLLTERNAPTQELVEKVKALHKQRNTDIRSLLPIMTGFEKQELLELIPKFVMNATFQKSVPIFFKKLLFGRHIQTHEPLLSPVELLLQLHHCEPKGMIEMGHLVHNTDLLIVDRSGLFNLGKEVVAQALEVLLNEYPFSKLLFHSLQKIYDRYPSLKGFIIKMLTNVAERYDKDEDLQRLVAKLQQGQRDPLAVQN
ncbi:unnamed protein product [Bursaphelenchus xylophilus]|uniref:(pine wood nematode) hypothetical protein n=1 Tax=Bursaphelenchus xylophilus TaxID=6326 RepID=A0A1I7RWY4_BURXY|nr:unnamed protein product [Bursaphelenchus xylophilus]CAG9121201.1 unnamed protein product [Bursaphelenchus xylophilus]